MKLLGREVKIKIQVWLPVQLFFYDLLAIENSHLLMIV